MRKLAIATIIVFAAGIAAVLAIPLEAQQPPKVTDPEYTVVFTFKKKTAVDSLCRIYILVSAKTEGEAAIRAHKYLSERLSVAAVEDIDFQEAQLRK